MMFSRKLFTALFGIKARYKYKNGFLEIRTDPQQPVAHHIPGSRGVIPHLLDHLAGIAENIRRIRVQRYSDFAFLNARCIDLQNEVDALRSSLVKAVKTKKKSSKKKK